MKQLELDQAVVISAYTGICCCNFGDMHAEVEKRLGEPVFTHQFADKNFWENKIKPAFRDDFIAICHPNSPRENNLNPATTETP